MGVFSYETKSVLTYNGQAYLYNHCERYDTLKNLGWDFTEDKKWKATKAFAIITPIIGGIALILGCVVRTPSAGKAIGLAFILCCLFQGLSLLVLQSDVCKDNPAINFIKSLTPAVGKDYPSECAWDTGFKLSISAVPMWFVAALAFMATRPEEASKE